MMISPWEIYWILQLDSIRSLFGVGVALIGLCSFVTLVFSPLLFDRIDGLGVSPKRVVAALGTGLIVFGGAYAFTPSTKTAAAMVIIPAIANNQAIQEEAYDLYSLAKQALVEAVKADEKTEK